MTESRQQIHIRFPAVLERANYDRQPRGGIAPELGTAFAQSFANGARCNPSRFRRASRRWRPPPGHHFRTHPIDGSRALSFCFSEKAALPTVLQARSAEAPGEMEILLQQIPF